MKNHSLGIHFLIDMYGVPFEVANDVNFLKKIFDKALEVSGVTVLNSFYHKFEPQGCSGIVLIVESHFSFHTYPENNIIMFDIFTCGDRAKPEKAVEYIINNIEHASIKISKRKRAKII